MIHSKTAGLSALLLSVSIGAVFMLPTEPSKVNGAGGGNAGAIDGILFAAAVATMALTMIGFLLVINRMPEWFRELLVWSTVTGLLVAIGGVAAEQNVLAYAVFGFSGGLIVVRLIQKLGIWWIMNNILYVAVGILFASLAATAIRPSFVITFIIGIMIYDHVFADRKDWMFQMASAQVRCYIPVLFLWPGKKRFQWSELKIGGDGTNIGGWGLGLGDALVPAVFIGSVTFHYETFYVLPLAAWGIIIALPIAASLLRIMIEHRSGAAMPIIGTWCLLGFATGWALDILINLWPGL